MTVFRAFLYLFIYLLRLFMRPVAVNEKKCFSLRLFRQEPEQGSAARCNGMLLIVSAASRLPESRRELHPLPASSPVHLFFLRLVMRLNRYFISSAVDVLTIASAIENITCFIPLPSFQFNLLLYKVSLQVIKCLHLTCDWLQLQYFSYLRFSPLHDRFTCSPLVPVGSSREPAGAFLYWENTCSLLPFLSASSLFVRTSRPQEPEQLFHFLGLPSSFKPSGAVRRSDCCPLFYSGEVFRIRSRCSCFLGVPPEFVRDRRSDRGGPLFRFFLVCVKRYLRRFLTFKTSTPEGAGVFVYE